MGTSETAAQALARLYDLDLAEDPGDVELYRALARRTGGPIVELAVGTGRIALPLAAEGHRVVGVDIDPAMLARARDRAAAAGDEAGSHLELADTDLIEAAAHPAVAAAGPFRLAILALNSILPARLRRATARRRRLAWPASWRRAASPSSTRGSRARRPRGLRRPPLAGVAAHGSRDRAATSPRPRAAWYDATSRLVTLTTIFEEGEPGAAPVRWTRTDALRLVTADELVRFAEDAGLEVEQLAGDYDARATGAGLRTGRAGGAQAG